MGKKLYSKNIELINFTDDDKGNLLYTWSNCCWSNKEWDYSSNKKGLIRFIKALITKKGYLIYTFRLKFQGIGYVFIVSFDLTSMSNNNINWTIDCQSNRNYNQEDDMDNIALKCDGNNVYIEPDIYLYGDREIILKTPFVNIHIICEYKKKTVFIGNGFLKYGNETIHSDVLIPTNDMTPEDMIENLNTYTISELKKSRMVSDFFNIANFIKLSITTDTKLDNVYIVLIFQNQNIWFNFDGDIINKCDSDINNIVSENRSYFTYKDNELYLYIDTDINFEPFKIITSFGYIIYIQNVKLKFTIIKGGK